MQQINDSAKATGWASICYNGEDIPANSLFKLLEARIPCGAEFDLCIRGDGEISTDALEKLAFSISNQSFDTVFDCTTP
jgi:phosphotransferase system HPr-like phosphotransfer protein